MQSFRARKKPASSLALRALNALAMPTSPSSLQPTSSRSPQHGLALPCNLRSGHLRASRLSRRPWLWSRNLRATHMRHAPVYIPFGKIAHGSPNSYGLSAIHSPRGGRELRRSKCSHVALHQISRISHDAASSGRRPRLSIKICVLTRNTHVGKIKILQVM